MLDKTLDFKKLEESLYAGWEEQGLFIAGRDEDGDKDPFTIMIPPPNVTGFLHIGHALNNSLQDVMIRWKRMCGKDALWVPGVDHAGIATQMVVERQLAAEGMQDRKSMGRDAFLERVWQWKQQSGGQIMRQLRRLGASCDWSRERFTMDAGLSEAVLNVFVTLYNQGLIYRDKRLVNWDPALETAISDLEVKPTEVKGKLYHIRYPIKDEADSVIIVATTRPETLFGDQAVAVHPEDQRYQHLIGKFCELPLTGRLIPIIADTHADPEHGSGAVKITPAHDFNDFEVGKRHQLELLNILTPNAHLNDSVPAAFQGLERFAARKQVITELEAQGLLSHAQDIMHTVPYGDRGGVPVEPYLTDQWYVDAKTLAKPAIEAVERGETRILPESQRKTYFNWMKDIQPWCISRQLWWGHRIPAWYGEDGKIFVALTEQEAYTQAEQHYKGEGNQAMLDQLKERQGLTQDPDVLDTWFSSALWPFSTLGWPHETPDMARFYPNSILITAFDILFFWVARMMMMGIHFTGKPPFHTVYVHALVLDAEGKKMSKTKGNVIDPLASIDDYGADALRFSLISQTGGTRNVRISDDRVRNSRNFITKLWNAARFLEMNGITLQDQFDPTIAKHDLSRWIIYEVETLKAKLWDELVGYRFADAAMGLYHFIWGTFCDWHVEFIKPLLAEDTPIAAELKQVTGWAFGELLKLFHPFCPFVTEQLWVHLHDDEAESLVRTAWPDQYEVTAFQPAWANTDALRRVIIAIRGVRSELNIPAKADLTLHIGGIEPAWQSLLTDNHALLQRLARVEKMADVPATPDKGVALLQIDRQRLALPLAGLIEFEVERERLNKEQAKLDKELNQLQVRLDNPQFLAKAPEEIVSELQERKGEIDQRLNDLSEMLDILR